MMIALPAFKGTGLGSLDFFGWDKHWEETPVSACKKNVHCMSAEHIFLTGLWLWVKRQSVY